MSANRFEEALEAARLHDYEAEPITDPNDFRYYHPSNMQNVGWANPQTVESIEREQRRLLEVDDELKRAPGAGL